MIKGTHDYLKELASHNVCAKHYLPVEIVYHVEEECLVLWCQAKHYVEELTTNADVSRPPLDGVTPLTDILPPGVIEGNIISMEEVIDKEIIVTEFTFHDSLYKEDQQYLSMEITLNHIPYILNTGAERIIQVFQMLGPDKLPVSLTFEKVTSGSGR